MRCSRLRAGLDTGFLAYCSAHCTSTFCAKAAASGCTPTSTDPRVLPRRRNCVSCITLAAFALASCATVPVPLVETVQVRVPVPVACVAAADIPAPPAKLARPLPDDADKLLSLVLGQLQRWVDYGDAVQPLLAGCARQP